MASFNYNLFKKVVAPEFASELDSDILDFANEAKLELSEAKWGKRYPRAWALITAHLMKTSKNASSGITGQLIKTKVGQLERQYSASSGSDDAYLLTSYGKEFIRLRKQVLITPIIIV